MSTRPYSNKLEHGTRMSFSDRLGRKEESPPAAGPAWIHLQPGCLCRRSNLKENVRYSVYREEPNVVVHRRVAVSGYVCSLANYLLSRLNQDALTTGR